MPDARWKVLEGEDDDRHQLPPRGQVNRARGRQHCGPRAHEDSQEQGEQSRPRGDSGKQRRGASRKRGRAEEGRTQQERWTA